MNSEKLVAIFAKRPVAGQVKTRLAEATSPDFAVGLAEAMLLDTLAMAKTLDCERLIVFAPNGAGKYFASRAGSDYRLTPQAGGDLGDRLARFFNETIVSYNRVVVIGADSPTLPARYISDAWDALTSCDVVLGPATDGGYYLVGCAGQTPPIFRGIEWSGPLVLEQTVERVVAAGLRLRLLPPWYDVDTAEDLVMLRGHLRAMHASGVRGAAEHVSRFLQSATATRRRET